MTVPHIQIILGSTRDGRVGERVARWVTGLAAERADLTFELIDLKAWELPFISTAIPPEMAPPQDPLIQRWEAKLQEADGYVFVTPEYNHGYPAALKNAIDQVVRPWRRKPVAFVGYGGPGAGVRAVEQLRQVVVELEMVPLRHQVSIARAYAAFDELGGLRESWHAAAAERLFADLEWWASALKGARMEAPPRAA